ncbi:Lactose transport system permease protein LacG [Roseobacter fucihabitans]|uniref:Lactose transport system permease protein LacG n=1 Tax=Roseobacter fucihabitans TaxID=1537242 RepID=A0ABZ2BRV9_9RHOB|nr:carbohydrate ABC transporter permease [Roseobacter litoralis]MBC6965563.1 Lactose transport system permease protein LacG [Roseobacter litoralis]
MTKGLDRILWTTFGLVFAAIWGLPFLYSVWTAFHDEIYSANFVWNAPLTLENFVEAWQAAPFALYFLNTFILISIVLAANLILCTLVAYAFVRYRFRWSGYLFALIMVQLLISPEILIVENYLTLSRIGMIDTILGIALPYLTSAFGIFLLRQTFMTVPVSLDEAAQIEGAGAWRVLWNIYVPLAKPVYLAYGLVSISFHWNNFLWPLIVTNSPEVRPVTVGLSVFATVESGVEWSLVNAATLMTTAPLIIAFVIFQRQFVANFMRAGIK